jgi:hypothetical protein
MYADDTVIYYSHKDIEVIEKKLQDDLASITSWLQQNQRTDYQYEKKENRRYAIWNWKTAEYFE